jgi:hypothetical protein
MMRKRFIVSNQGSEHGNEQWLDLANLATVEVTSESTSHPIESAILHDGRGGWRAAGPAEQTIRIVFDEPQDLTRVRLVFEEHEIARSHEFVLRWLPEAAGEHYREVVRQQWNFIPPTTTREVEDYRFHLSKVKALELVISAQIGGQIATASLLEMRLA